MTALQYAMIHSGAQTEEFCAILGLKASFGTLVLCA
jgi:hypothetical protein